MTAEVPHQQQSTSAPVLALFSLLPPHLLKRAYLSLPPSDRSQGLGLREFVRIVKKVIREEEKREGRQQLSIHQPGSEKVTSRADFPTPTNPSLVLSSPSGSGESGNSAQNNLLQSIVDVYKQVDARGEGKVKWTDVAGFLMQIDVMQESSASAAGGEGSSQKMQYHLIPVQDTSTYITPLLRLRYLPAPIHKLSMVQSRNEGVKLLIPNRFSGEVMPRSGMELSHHTNFLQHNVVESVCVEGEDCIISSSQMDEEKTKRTGGFISVWDIPTAEERSSGTQFLATLVQRFETEFPQECLCHSSREDMLFSASPRSGVVLCSRIKKSVDEVFVKEASEIHKEIMAAKAAGGGGVGSAGGGSGLSDDLQPLRSDPKVLKDILTLNSRTRLRQKEGSIIKKDAVSALTKSIMDLEKMAAPAKKKKVKVEEKVSKKIRFNNAGISALLEIRSTDGGNFLLGGSVDGSIICLDLQEPFFISIDAEQFIVRKVNAHEQGVKLLGFSESYDLIFTVGNCKQNSNANVFVWDSDREHGIKEERKGMLKGHEEEIAAIEIVDEENNAITIDILGNLRVFSLTSMSMIQHIEPSNCFHDGPVIDMTTIPPTKDGKNVIPRMLVAITGDGMQIYNRKILDITDPVIMSLYNTSFHNFITLSANRVSVFDAHKGKLLRAYEKSKILGESETFNQHDFTYMCLTKSGRKIIIADDGGEITVINFLSGAVVKKLDPHAGPVTWLGFSMSEKCVMSTGMDGVLHILDEVDTEGYVAGKNSSHGHSVPIRSVLLKSIQIKTRGGPAGYSGSLARTMAAAQVFQQQQRSPSPTWKDDDDNYNSNSNTETSPNVTTSTMSMSNRKRSRRASVTSQTANMGPQDSLTSLSDNSSSKNIGSSSPTASRHNSILASVNMQHNVHQSRRRSDMGRRSSFLCASEEENLVLGKSAEEMGSNELLNSCFSTHLNLIATATTSGLVEHHLHVWDYETCELIGTCVEPNATPGKSLEVLDMEFLSPVPLLLGAVSSGVIHAWLVPSCVTQFTLLPSEDTFNCWTEYSGSVKLAEATITGLAVQIFKRSDLPSNVELLKAKSSEEANEMIYAVFASNEKGVVFAWYLTEKIMDIKNISSRRRSSFNPFRIVHNIIGVDELTTRRRISRSYQPRTVSERTPSTCWRAHSDSISNIASVNSPISLITSSADCSAKIWDVEGNPLGTLNLNESTMSNIVTEPWHFRPQTQKQTDDKTTAVDFYDFIKEDEAKEIEQVTRRMSKKLMRHPSQENFLNKTLHRGNVHVHRSTIRRAKEIRKSLTMSKQNSEGGGVGTGMLRDTRGASKIHNDSFQTLGNASLETYTTAETIPPIDSSENSILGGNSHAPGVGDWNNMMESLHIFDTALGYHTKERAEEEREKAELKKIRDPNPQQGKHWKLAKDLDALNAFGSRSTKTLPRMPIHWKEESADGKNPPLILKRGTTAPGTRRARTSFGHGGRVDTSEMRKQQLAQHITASGQFAFKRPSTTGGPDADGNHQVTRTIVNLKHMGF